MSDNIHIYLPIQKLQYYFCYKWRKYQIYTHIYYIYTSLLYILRYNKYRYLLLVRNILPLQFHIKKYILYIHIYVIYTYIYYTYLYMLYLFVNILLMNKKAPGRAISIKCQIFILSRNCKFWKYKQNTAG